MRMHTQLCSKWQKNPTKASAALAGRIGLPHWPAALARRAGLLLWWKANMLVSSSHAFILLSFSPGFLWIPLGLKPHHSCWGQRLLVGVRAETAYQLPVLGRGWTGGRPCTPEPVLCSDITGTQDIWSVPGNLFLCNILVKSESQALRARTCLPTEAGEPERKTQRRMEFGVQWIIPEGLGLVPSPAFERGTERRLSPSWDWEHMFSDSKGRAAAHGSWVIHEPSHF